MAEIIKSSTRGASPHHYWHLIGDDPRKVQYIFEWTSFRLWIGVEQMIHPGSEYQGVNHHTGKTWGTPAMWSGAGSIKVPLDLSLTILAQMSVVEDEILKYIDTALHLSVEKIAP